MISKKDLFKNYLYTNGNDHDPIDSYSNAISSLSNAQILSSVNLELDPQIQHFINQINLQLQYFLLKIREVFQKSDSIIEAFGNTGSIAIYSIAQSSKFKSIKTTNVVTSSKEYFIYQKIMNLITLGFFLLSSILLETCKENVKYSLLYLYYNYYSSLISKFNHLILDIEIFTKYSELDIKEKNMIIISKYISFINMNTNNIFNNKTCEIYYNLYQLSKLTYNYYLDLSIDSKQKLMEHLKKIILLDKKVLSSHSTIEKIPNLLEFF